MTFSKLAVLSLLAALTCAACSSADDGQTPTPGPGSLGDKRVPIGKADSVSGTCLVGSKSLCGGKSEGSCYCDTACVEYGDCCADAVDLCGLKPAEGCAENADCKSDEFCHSPDGCDALGQCVKKPTHMFCASVSLPYCSCEGETKYSSSSCILDRFAYSGTCGASDAGTDAAVD